jgi:hypothetical protein
VRTSRTSSPLIVNIHPLTDNTNFMIHISNIELSDFSKLELPAKIYKYRKWTDPLHKRILTHREVYFASPESFVDKNDCKIPIRYDLLNLKEVIEGVKLHNPNWNRKRCRSFA